MAEIAPQSQDLKQVFDLVMHSSKHRDVALLEEATKEALNVIGDTQNVETPLK